MALSSSLFLALCENSGDFSCHVILLLCCWSFWCLCWSCSPTKRCKKDNNEKKNTGNYDFFYHKKSLEQKALHYYKALFCQVQKKKINYTCIILVVRYTDYMVRVA